LVRESASLLRQRSKTNDTHPSRGFAVRVGPLSIRNLHRIDHWVGVSGDSVKPEEGCRRRHLIFLHPSSASTGQAAEGSALGNGGGIWLGASRWRLMRASSSLPTDISNFFFLPRHPYLAISRVHSPLRTRIDSGAGLLHQGHPSKPIVTSPRFRILWFQRQHDTSVDAMGWFWADTAAAATPAVSQANSPHKQAGAGAPPVSWSSNSRSGFAIANYHFSLDVPCTRPPSMLSPLPILPPAQLVRPAPSRTETLPQTPHYRPEPSRITAIMRRRSNGRSLRCSPSLTP